MTTDTTDKLAPPEKEVRADLWSTMSVSQLHHQQDLLLERVNRLQTLVSAGGVPAAVGLLKVLQQAMVDLTVLIESKSNTNPKRQ